MFQSENLEYCAYRVTRETLLEFLPVKINREEIPSQGLCTISESQKSPCQYPGLSQGDCPIGRGNDFCERSWAKEFHA